MTVEPFVARQEYAVRAVVAADAWMLDVDGCLVRTVTAGGAGGTAIPGAAELLAWLRQHGKPFVVCTNASQRPAREYARHLREIGLDIADAEMVTAANAAADHIATTHPGVPVLVVGDRGLVEALRERGIEPVLPGGASAGVVVVGVAGAYTSATLNAACLAVADHGAAFYVTGGAAST